MTSRRSDNQRVGSYQPLLTNLTNPIPEGLVGNGPPLGGAYQPTNPEGAKVGITNDLPTNLNDLCVLKERLNNGVAYCLKHRAPRRAEGYGRPEQELWDDQPPKYQRGYARLVRILSREYLPAITALQDTYPREALEQERESITTRLETGWQLDDTPSRARTFAKLLTRYEVLADALDGDVMGRHLSRVEAASA